MDQRCFYPTPLLLPGDARSREAHLLSARLEATRSGTVAESLGLIPTRYVCSRNKGDVSEFAMGYSDVSRAKRDQIKAI